MAVDQNDFALKKALFLTPCKTSKELRNWIQYFLGMEVPNCKVSRYADSTPSHMIWEIYKLAILKQNPEQIKEILYCSSRNSGKTLGLAIAEFLMMFHDQRECAHVGAILAQAAACKGYIGNFLMMPKVRELFIRATKRETEGESFDAGPNSPIMILQDNESRLVFNLDNKIVKMDILPCTVKALNSKHPSFCLSENSLIDTDKYGKIEIKELYSKYQTEKDIRAVSYNFMTNEPELKEIEGIYCNGVKETISLYYSGQNYGKVTLTPDHKIWSPNKNDWEEAKDFKIGDNLLKLTQKGRKFALLKEKEWYTPLPKQELSKDEEFEQVLLGSLLGDGGVYKRWRTCKKAVYKEGHGEKQINYLKWKKEILSYKLEFNNDVQNYSGYTDTYSGLRIVSKSSELLLPYCIFKNEDTTYKNRHEGNKFKKEGIRRKPQTLDFFDENILNKIDRLALAVWFMDDGNKDQLITYGYSYTQNQQLCRIIKEKFNVEFNIKPAKKGKYYYLQIKTYEDKYRLYSLIDCYIRPELRYKIDCNFKRDKTPNIELIKILDIKKTPGAKTVYDLTIKDNHNLFSDTILVSNCSLDEVDTLDNEGVRALKELSGMGTTRDGKPYFRVNISTRKSRYGIMNKMMEEAESRGRSVRKWTIWEFTERCGDARSGTIPTYAWTRQSDLSCVTEREYAMLSMEKKRGYEKNLLLDGCVCNSFFSGKPCPAASVCLTDSKKQRCKSPMLKPVDETIQRIISEDPDWALSQLMNLKPSLEGTIYREFDETLHVKTWNQIWLALTGGEFPGICTHDIFVKKCKELKLNSYAGVDFGYINPAAVVIFYIDGRDNIYVVRADSATGMNDPSWIHYIKTKYHNVYNVQLYFPDMVARGSVDIMQTVLPVGMFTKTEVNYGIQLVKKFLRVPGGTDTKLHIAKETCYPLIDEFTKYHYKTDSAGQVIDIPEKEHDHNLDAFRYGITALYGNARAIIEGDSSGLGSAHDIIDYKTGSYSRCPTAAEFAETQGVAFNDNSADNIKTGDFGTIAELNKKKEEEGGDGEGGEGSFLFSF